MKSVLLVAVVLGMVIASAGSSIGAPGSPPAPAALTKTWSYTLYASQSAGWGFNTSTMSRPGPTLTVPVGDVLALELFSADGNTHSWGIDVNNDSVIQASEPHSANFSSSIVPLFYDYSVSLQPGTYTYRCGFHPSAMWGEIVILPAADFVLWGSADTSGAYGWGFTPDNITYPGPTLNVTYGQVVSIDLYSADGMDHDFYVDFAASTSPADNNVSDVFNGTHPIRFTFTASRLGDFTYASGIDGAATMDGIIHVAAAPTPPAPDYTLYAIIAVIVIVIVAIGAVLAFRRKPRTPPTPPPASPPS